ncbi:CwfJ domain containing protein [Nitzschia inconspicua]|uniref:CwfJ domain containing protein n=1 Tax=Nitzschia inconspicua TaxID=303405 RepID=A0A9K3Q0F0_9STRA|nr:CwfJ domain containing protein [Nitzschia inconspicua]
MTSSAAASSSSCKIKILLVGSVKGDEEVQVLYKKLISLNGSKAGPFDVCFGVGTFRFPSSKDTTAISEFPIPLYVQQLSSDGTSTTSTVDDQGIETVGSVKNLHVLKGTKDRSLNVFQIHLQGHDHPLYVGSCPPHVRAVEDTNSSSSAAPTSIQQCDLLLSSDWPQGMEDVLQVDTEPLSYDVAQVALQCRPRYHVAPSTVYYHASPPYSLPNSDHVGRFLALSPVLSAANKPTKTTKFIHALGLEPLASNPPPTKAPSTLPCPFMSSDSDNTGRQQQQKQQPLPNFARQGTNMNNGGGYSFFAQSTNNKRSRKNEDGTNDNSQTSLEPPDDPNISTLFLYGLHKDVTGELQSTRSPKLLQVFAKYNCSAVRHPPNANTTTYCFLEFPSQKQAMECLLDLQGRITIDGVDLTLKWAAPRQHQQQNKRQRVDTTRHYVTQEEAKDSNTLFFNPPKKETNLDSKKESDEKALDGPTTTTTDREQPSLEEGFAESLRVYLEKTLEDALNEGVGEDEERITAETEPALKVDVRVKETYGFLEFASHAAATMALAALTKSTDGGVIQPEPDGAPPPPAKLVGTNLRWAKGGPPPSTKKGSRDDVLEALGVKRQIFPADNRTDCWFCLASPSCETHLITGVYDEWYTAMPKGPVHPGHILLVPVTHTRQGAWNLNDEWVILVEKLQQHAASAYDMDLFVFERSMETKGGYHTHVQCVPVPRECITQLQTTMMAHAKASGFDLRVIQSDLGVKTMLSKDDSYFYAEIRTRSQNYRFFYRHDAGDQHATSVPLQFAREVLAAVLKNPKLAHWKACVVDKEQETELAANFRESFNATV